MLLECYEAPEESNDLDMRTRHYPPSHKCNYRTAFKRGFINREKKLPSHLNPLHIILLLTFNSKPILETSFANHIVIKIKHIGNKAKICFAYFFFFSRGNCCLSDLSSFDSTEENSVL